MIISKFYEPSGSLEQYDTELDQWFTNSGQELRDPSDYYDDMEGYTPFGDE